METLGVGPSVSSLSILNYLRTKMFKNLAKIAKSLVVRRGCSLKDRTRTALDRSTQFWNSSAQLELAAAKVLIAFRPGLTRRRLIRSSRCDTRRTVDRNSSLSLALCLYGLLISTSIWVRLDRPFNTSSFTARN